MYLQRLSMQLFEMNSRSPNVDYSLVDIEDNTRIDLSLLVDLNNESNILIKTKETKLLTTNTFAKVG
jgi:hypothetical protein